MKRFFFLCVAANLLSIAVCAQRGITANVLDVVDGRTVVLDVAGGRLNAQLQYIETPEPEQALHQVVKEHLAKLAVGKTAEFRAARMVGGKPIGRVTVDGVDLSAQMIRDGAAWHEPREISGQPAPEADEYEKNQQLARSEKRGVWSGAILKTPWEVRAEKEAQRRAVDTARKISHPTLVGLGEFQSDVRRPSGNHVPVGGVSERNQMNAWVNVFAGVGKEPYGLRTYTDPKGKYTEVYTSASLIDFATASGKERVECRAMLVVPTLNTGQGKFYLLGFRAISTDYRFSKGKTRVLIVADGKPLALGAPSGWRRQGLQGAEEIMLFKVSWALLKKIGSAKNVEVKIDKLTAALPNDARDLIKQLVEATS